MSKPLDELYLTWLYSQVADETLRKGSRTYWKLAKQLYTTEFIWYVPNDDNRMADGQYLREEFIEDLRIDIRDIDRHWWEDACSMLELLIGLSRRLSFQANGPPSNWFWILIENLDLRYPDRGHYPDERVEEVLNTVNFRTYDAKGRGGLFPLKHPDCDQRDADLWYQLSAYLLENY